MSTAKCYELVGNEKEYVKATREEKFEFRLLMIISPLMHANINKAWTNAMLSSDA